MFHKLVEAILAGDLPAGGVLKESELAARWHVSRTPIREAVRRAAEAGFVTLRPNRTPIVKALSEDDVRGLYDLREVLEAHALELAWDAISECDIARLASLAERAHDAAGSTAWVRACLDFDLALHGTWATRCGNAWLMADIARLHQFLRIFQHWIGNDPTALAAAYDEHVAIVDALRGSDRAIAVTLVRDHIRASCALVLRALARNSSAGA